MEQLNVYIPERIALNLKALSCAMTVSSQMLKELSSTVVDVVSRSWFLDRAIQKRLNANKHWHDDERSLFAEACIEIVRNWRRLLFATGRIDANHEASATAVCAAFLLMNKIPLQRNEAVHFSRNVESYGTKWKDSEAHRTICYSYPDWLDQLCEHELGSMWDTTIAALHTKPRLSLRTNTLRTSPTELAQSLKARGIRTHGSNLAPEALILNKHSNVFAFPEFREGMFEVQDEASQCVATFCEVESGMRVIDACAGSGGKSLHLAALMQNKGRIVALDSEARKLEDLSKRSKRAHADNIETRVITSTKVVKRLTASAQRVLLDVPCTGLGVLRRNPDTKWHLSPTKIDEFISMQRSILESYSSMTAPGGKLIYATCSILPREGEEQVRWFIQKFPQWSIEAERRIQPQSEGCDGFYMARLIRSET